MALNQRSRDLVAATSPGETLSRVTAVLGPTNTGKTHYAIERMLAQPSGMIGLPLRLLAREVYDRVVAAKGVESAALVTGEEKIVPRAPNYWVCTVESMPLDIETDFLAVDEIQLCADTDRGHIFTHRLLHARGKHETVFLGSETMRPTIHRLLPRTTFISRPRFSDLAYTGSKKILPSSPSQPTRFTALPSSFAVSAAAPPS
jgi:ATP-dependent RNA helicase SUPV3L1/SUV3